MIYEEKQQAKNPHNITLENREKLMITGVVDVECFDENEIIMQTTHGVLYVTGTDIHMEKLNTDSGDIVVFGIIYDLKYEDSKELHAGWMKKLFSK